MITLEIEQCNKCGSDWMKLNLPERLSPWGRTEDLTAVVMHLINSLDGSVLVIERKIVGVCRKCE